MLGDGGFAAVWRGLAFQDNPLQLTEIFLPVFSVVLCKLPACWMIGENDTLR